jgi:hypothetical protein
MAIIGQLRIPALLSLVKTFSIHKRARTIADAVAKEMLMLFLACDIYNTYYTRSRIMCKLLYIMVCVCVCVCVCIYIYIHTHTHTYMVLLGLFGKYYFESCTVLVGLSVYWPSMHSLWMEVLVLFQRP